MESSEAGSQAAIGTADNMAAVEEKAGPLSLGDEIAAMVLKRQSNTGPEDKTTPDKDTNTQALSPVEPPVARSESPLVRSVTKKQSTGDLQSEIQSMIQRLGSSSPITKTHNAALADKSAHSDRDETHQPVLSASPKEVKSPVPILPSSPSPVPSTGMFTHF